VKKKDINLVSIRFEMAGGIVFWYMVASQEKHTVARLMDGLANEKVHKCKVARMVLMPVQLLNAVIFLLPGANTSEDMYYMFAFLMSATYLLAFYFYCCTPLPPGKSKFRECMEKLQGLLAPQQEFCPAAS